MNSLGGHQGFRGTTGSNLQGTSSGNFDRSMSRKSIDQGDIVPKGQRLAQIQNYTPQQLQQHEQMFQHVGPESYLSRLAGGDQSMFDELEAPAWRQFQELQGQTASRFSGAGMGARRGSGFQNQMGQQGNDFLMNLQSQRLGMRNQALQELMGYSNMLLGQRPYEKAMYDKQQKQNPWGQMAGKAFGPAAGFAVDLINNDTQWRGTQEGVNASYDIAKSMAGMGG